MCPLATPRRFALARLFHQSALHASALLRPTPNADDATLPLVGLPRFHAGERPWDCDCEAGRALAALERCMGSERLPRRPDVGRRHTRRPAARCDDLVAAAVAQGARLPLPVRAVAALDARFAAKLLAGVPRRGACSACNGMQQWVTCRWRRECRPSPDSTCGRATARDVTQPLHTAVTLQVPQLSTTRDELFDHHYMENRTGDVTTPGLQPSLRPPPTWPVPTWPMVTWSSQRRLASLPPRTGGGACRQRPLTAACRARARADGPRGRHDGQGGRRLPVGPRVGHHGGVRNRPLRNRP